VNFTALFAADQHKNRTKRFHAQPSSPGGRMDVENDEPMASFLNRNGERGRSASRGLIPSQPVPMNNTSALESSFLVFNGPENEFPCLLG